MAALASTSSAQDTAPQPLPAEAQAQIDAMEIARTPVDTLAIALDAERKSADALADEDQKKAARQAYQQHLNRLAREAQQRFVLRALYSPNQLQEQMTWFWMNHFNVSQRKGGDMRGLIGDYEENAIRPHALGRFRDLLGATLHHPAMLRYLDNAQACFARRPASQQCLRSQRQPMAGQQSRHRRPCTRPGCRCGSSRARPS